MSAHGERDRAPPWSDLRWGLFFGGGGMLACRAGILPFLSFSPQESELLKPSEVLYFEKSGDEVGTCVRVG